MITQGFLLDAVACSQKEVVRNAVKANFITQGDNRYEVVLEVNSNKFLLDIVRENNNISAFEVLSVKGFTEISTRIIVLLKRLINHLWDLVD